ncbi:uncharacterized protein [Malus domestica]|uniref:uncharacterized protein n=1 Tax=Malus domestica TaxID=3750 RepID=UPI0039771E3B
MYEFEGNDVEISMVATHDNYWTMYFDGSSTSVSASIGIVIQSPTHSHWYFSLKLDFNCANNQAEYEALVIGLSVLHDLRVTRVLVLNDPKLVINQLNGTFRCMSCTLAPYHMVASYLAESFDDVTFKYISQVHNTDADELDQIAFGAQLLRGKLGQEIPVSQQAHSALINQQVLQRDYVIRTQVMSLPSLLERKDTIKVRTIYYYYASDRKKLPKKSQKFMKEFRGLIGPAKRCDGCFVDTAIAGQVNGQTEASNKVLIGILEKMVRGRPDMWHLKLNEALWAYQTSFWSTTGMTSYTLTYGHDALLPVELSINSLRVIEQSSLFSAEYSRAMRQELEDLEEAQLDAYNLLVAQKKIVERAYNQRVKQKMFGDGE